MAEVFVATQKGDGGFEKTVAIKRILPHLCEEAETVSMFRDEAHLASRLNHPNIAQVHDLVEDGETLLIAMEWIEGKDLRRILQRAAKNGPRLTPVRALAIARSVAEALAHAHSARGSDGEPLRLVHRDVSPHNVMITYEGAVKLTDFGIAKATQRSVNTATGMIKGKVAYMSPEQARGDEVDARTDVFALGIILWEMLCGRRLFTGESDLAILRAVQEQAAPAPSSVVPGLPERVDELVLAALRRDREQRLPTAEAFARTAGEILLEAASHPDDLALGPWMRALYPAESMGERKGTAKQPAATVAPPAPGAAGPTEVPTPGTPQTRPDLPGALVSEARPGAVAVTSALGPEDLEPQPTGARSRGTLVVSLLWLVALVGLGLNYLEVGPFARKARVTPPAAPVARATPAPPAVVAPEPTAQNEAAPSLEALAPTPETATLRPMKKPRSRADRRRPPVEEAKPDPPAAVVEAPPTPAAIPEESTEPAASPEPLPIVAETPKTTVPPRGGTRVLSRRETPSTPAPIQLPVGTPLEARLLDSARAGGRVRLSLLRSVVRAGRVAIPRGTRLVATPRAADRRLLFTVSGGTTPGGKPLDLQARVVDDAGTPGLLAADPSDPGAPLLLAPGTTVKLELIQALSIEN